MEATLTSNLGPSLMHSSDRFGSFPLTTRRQLSSGAILACVLLGASAAAAEPSRPMLLAGSGSPPSSVPYPPGQPSGIASEIPLGNPFGIEVSGESVWLTTVDDHCIWRTDLDGRRLIRVAGTGQSGYSGDGGQALEATFNWPHEVRVDGQGNLLVADTRNHVIRWVDATSGRVKTIAGNGSPGFAGDGHSGSSVQFKQPHSVVFDQRGGILVADTQNHRLRRIDLGTGIVETVSGTGRGEMPVDGSDAKTASLFGPRSLAVDIDSIWIALREGNSIWRIDRHTGTIHHVAGTGKKGYSGDGGPALQATFNGPKGLVLDDHQGVLVVDTENQAVRRIDLAAGTVVTVLGGTLAGTTATLKRPHGIASQGDRGFFVADSENHRVLIGK
jgi:hypothetical protein